MGDIDTEPSHYFIVAVPPQAIGDDEATPPDWSGRPDAYVFVGISAGMAQVAEAGELHEAVANWLKGRITGDDLASVAQRILEHVEP